MAARKTKTIPVGVEPTASRFPDDCSTIELRNHVFRTANFTYISLRLQLTATLWPKSLGIVMLQGYSDILIHVSVNL